MAFNPNEHLSKVQKPNDYLQVKWRLVWFREDHPHGKISTNMVHFDPEKQMAIFKATVEDSKGGVSEGYGSESVKDFRDFIEKAETKAVGRALAGLGYGTQFAPELDEGSRIADSPVERNTTKTPAETRQAAKSDPVAQPSAEIQKAITSCLKRAQGMGLAKTRESWTELKKEAGVNKSDADLQSTDLARINGLLTEREKAAKSPVAQSA
jgi:hypothetical protein